MESKELLGHALVETTQRYVRLVPRDVLEAHRKYHPREQ